MPASKPPEQPTARPPSGSPSSRPALSATAARLASGTWRRRRTHRRRMTGLATCVLGLFLLWRLAVHTRLGQALDTLAMHRLTDLAAFDPSSISVTHTVISFGGLAAIVLAVALLAVLRGRWQLAIRAVAVLAGANLTTQLLKTFLLSRPDLGIGWALPPSLPSGHTTAAAATAVAAIMVVPPAWRTVSVLVGTAWTGFIGLTTLINGWHRPADVIAAVLVATAWGFMLSPNESGPIATARLRLTTLTLGTIATVLGALGVAAAAIRLNFSGLLVEPFVPGIPTTRVLTSASGHGGMGIVAATGAVLLFLGLTALLLRQIDLIRSDWDGRA
ncbi:phosphatase PAP2 family protein [Bowdeniella nasicola]|uniref:phosphatase PAP2 family protein n=1 Tax=Bowdeniella nasicola TaxID=208480 RepID=UPI0011610DA5|nr:phosphatase PAP2 family protein [Bowdeniella nasicola]